MRRHFQNLFLLLPTYGAYVFSETSFGTRRFFSKHFLALCVPQGGDFPLLLQYFSAYRTAASRCLSGFCTRCLLGRILRCTMSQRFRLLLRFQYPVTYPAMASCRLASLRTRCFYRHILYGDMKVVAPG